MKYRCKNCGREGFSIPEGNPNRCPFCQAEGMDVVLIPSKKEAPTKAKKATGQLKK